MMRPLIGKSIDQLEELSLDPSLKEGILVELSFRKSSRARKLLESLNLQPSSKNPVKEKSSPRFEVSKQETRVAEFLANDSLNQHSGGVSTRADSIESMLLEFAAGSISASDYIERLIEIRLEPKKSDRSKVDAILVGRFDQRKALQKVESEHTELPVFATFVNGKVPIAPKPLWGQSALARTAHVDPHAVSNVFDRLEVENELIVLLASLINAGFEEYEIFSFIPRDYSEDEIMLRAKKLALNSK